MPVVTFMSKIVTSLISDLEGLDFRKSLTVLQSSQSNNIKGRREQSCYLRICYEMHGYSYLGSAWRMNTVNFIRCSLRVAAPWAAAYLHSRHVKRSQKCHHDLVNFPLALWKAFQVQVCDKGISHLVEPSTQVRTACAYYVEGRDISALDDLSGLYAKLFSDLRKSIAITRRLLDYLEQWSICRMQAIFCRRKIRFKIWERQVRCLQRISTALSLSVFYQNNSNLY